MVLGGHQSWFQAESKEYSKAEAKTHTTGLRMGFRGPTCIFGISAVNCVGSGRGVAGPPC